MSFRVFLYIIVVIISSFSCSGLISNEFNFSPPDEWPTINKSEIEVRKYLDENLTKLDPLEGIWMVNTSGTWRDPLTGKYGNLDNDNNIYRIAIIRDSTNLKYEYTAFVLESKYLIWSPGRIKAYFRKTAYENIYECLWYNYKYEKEYLNFLIDESGVLKANSISNLRSGYNIIESNILTFCIKSYPLYKDKIVKDTSSREYRKFGSGFLISSNGLVVTNYHIIENSSKIDIFFPSKKLHKNAILRLRDIKNDLVILEIQNFLFSEISNNPIPFSFADINTVKVGQEVFTLGFPFGELVSTNPSLSTGRINNLFGFNDDPRLFQINNPVQPGNSGGPLFNNKGELVGIVVASLNAKYFYENIGVIPQNVNFAIKSNYLKNLIQLLPEGEEIINRKNSITDDRIESVIEKINPFIVQIRTY